MSNYLPCAYCSCPYDVDCNCKVANETARSSWAGSVDIVVRRYRESIKSWLRYKDKFEFYSETDTISAGLMTATVIKTKTVCILTVAHNRDRGEDQSLRRVNWGLLLIGQSQVFVDTTNDTAVNVLRDEAFAKTIVDFAPPSR